MKRIRRHPRRGVLLLVILGLLAMFGLVAMAFVVLTGQAKRGAIAASRAEVRVDSPRELTDQAALALLRGDRNAMSAVRAHGLLEDMYGYSPSNVGPTAFRCFVSAPTAACGGALIEVTVTGASGAVTEPWWFVGRVLTVLDGPAKGLSTHVVGYNPTTQKLQIRAFDDAPMAAITYNKALINGPAFGGRGFGYTSASLAGRPSDLALQPGADDNAWGNGGGANEEYDAVDSQNMHMALAVPLPLAWPQSAAGPVPVPIPSFHRADLVQYWMQRNSIANWTSLPPATARQIILRPLPLAGLHPNFTGSNPYFDPTWNGVYNAQKSWDVDNDGDGIADSIWLDLGFPVRAAPDGRLYKPLAAILCLDLDGRLNLNVHGNMYQASSAYSTQYRGMANSATDAPTGQALFGNGAGGTSSMQLPRGLGWGPAEINLLSLFDYPAGSGTYQTGLYEKLLVGDAANALEGRYGEGAGGSRWPGLTGVADPLSFNMRSSDPDNYYAGPRHFGSPPDAKGLMCVALDPGGRPVYAMMGGLWAGSQTDVPYEKNVGRGEARGLIGPTRVDNGYSPAELERILRAMDVDAPLLPSRLARLTYLASANNSILVPRRNEITTESWDAPYAPFAFNPANPDDPRRPGHVCEMLKLKFSLPASDTGATNALLRGKLLAPEMLCGLKMNINRRLGDGLDNNGNGVIDEMEEAALESFPQRNAAGADATLAAAQTDLTNGVDVNNSGGVDATDEQLARQLFARYLYCLAMMVCDLDYLDQSLGGSRDATCRYLAQWAVNVVDFRDRDSIMTCFEYDPNPFGASGWRCDGNPLTNDGITQPHVVWGCERPELLITETLATHDRRVEDLNTDSSNHYTTDTSNPDDDFDQRLRPRGSLFVELFNPWTVMEPVPNELYLTGSSGGPGVDLAKRAGGSATGAPVWRLAIVPYTNVTAGQPQPDPSDVTAASPVMIERSVYFVDPGAGLYMSEDANTQRYYPSSTAGAVLPVQPGRYAVVGPGESDAKAARNPRVTFLGIPSATTLTTSQSEADVANNAARQIELAPGGATPVMVRNNGTFDVPTANIQTPVAVVIDSPYRLSVTEPTGKGTDTYYDATDAGAGGTGAAYDEATGGYAKPFDEPMDKGRPNSIWDTLRKDGSTPRFRVIHLQRLANPLAAYNKDTNPYVTVDTMAIDLTTFNGIVDDGAHADHSGGTLSYAVTRERGEFNDPTNPSLDDLWRHEPESGIPQTRGAGTQDYRLPHNLGHSLGFLNYHLNRGGSAPRRLPRAAPAMYQGTPQNPFPWLTWLNRPFVNQYELLLAPGTGQYQLLHTFRAVTPGSTPNAYQPAGATDVPFPHLLNFFQTAVTPRSGAATRTSPLLYRLLDYVTVRSRFPGTTVQVAPALAAGSTGHFFRPPFNRIPLFREPGRVNLNTLTSPSVGEGLVNFYPGLWDMGMWDKFVASRKGASATGSSDPLTIEASMLAHNATQPSRFARPFRSWYGSYLTPSSVAEPQEIESTIMRSYTDTGVRRPLLENRNDQSNEQFYGNTDANPYFRYQGIQKLGNMVTTRSNVYAVWVTVGYFEVAPWPAGADDAHRDGYQLGRELGIDTGEVARHRAFYIIDRTIPVAFERGQDYNVEKTILLRRYIE